MYMVKSLMGLCSTSSFPARAPHWARQGKGWRDGGRFTAPLLPSQDGSTLCYCQALATGLLGFEIFCFVWW